MLRTNKTIGEGLICKVTEKDILESKKKNMNRMESWEPIYTHVLTKSRQEYWEIKKNYWKMFIGFKSWRSLVTLDMVVFVQC